MANLKQKSETERAIELALDHFKMALQAITGKTDLELYIQVRGVPVETLVQTSQEVKTAENCGLDNNQTNHYVNIDFTSVHLTLNTLNEL